MKNSDRFRLQSSFKFEFEFKLCQIEIKNLSAQYAQDKKSLNANQQKKSKIISKSKTKKYKVSRINNLINFNANGKEKS